jgi:crotonobetainyl-CoA:carnitine CoA-transferase CaiB-like acyl-CoA transferase
MSAGLTSSNAWESLVKWLADYNIENWQELLHPRWQELKWRLSETGKKQFYDIFSQLTLRKTKLELYEEGQKRNVPIAPINNLKDVLENPQLIAREFFQKVKHEDLSDSLIYPGPPYRFSDSKWSITPAPKKGEHTVEVLTRLGYGQQEIIHLREGGVI